MLQPGEEFSHYKIISVLGSGGMGEVYLAEDTTLERHIALKVLLDEVAGDPERVRRFIREAKASSALNHPNILTVFEIGNVNGHQYIAAEYIKGLTLRDRVNNEPLILRDALDITLQVAAALGAAHEAGIVHRDIKPENIMIRDDSLVKVLDFGLAKLFNQEIGSQDSTLVHHDTQPGMLVGTVAYMSPEQARGRKLDPRSDIFSLGIVMYELLTGKRPFDGENHLDLVSCILKDEAQPLRQVDPNLPRQLERIVDKALRKDVEHRYQHIRDLYIDVEDLKEELKLETKLNRSLGSGELSAPRTTQASELRSAFKTGITQTRRFTLLHAFLFVLAAICLVGAAWYIRSGRPAPAAVDSYKIAELATWGSAPGEITSKATFSPDGKLIAFASTKSGTKNIWVTQATSTDAIQITNDQFANTEPVWSPDGHDIAYFSDRSSAGSANLTGIWRVPGLGGGTPKLVGAVNAKSVDMRRWTQSGKIYYQFNNELYAMDTASGTSQRVPVPAPDGTFWIDISPDEKTLAFATRSDGIGRILTADAGSEKVVEVATGLQSVDNSIIWLPDKKRLFYGALTDGVMQIFAKDTGTAVATRVTSTDTDNSVVDAAPDGHSIILSSAKEESNIWRVNVSDAQESPVSRDLNTKLWPAVSPDDEKVAFQSFRAFRGGNSVFDGDIVVRSLRSKDEGERPTLLAANGFFPAYSPDGSSVAFMRKSADKPELYSINPNGGGERLLTSGGIQLMGYSISPYNYIHARAFAFSPDGSRIAYVSDRNGASNIWAVGVRDNSDTPLTNNTDTTLTFNSPMWSPDGRKIALSFQDRPRGVRGIKVFNAGTGETVDLSNNYKAARLIGWSADENGVLIAESDVSSGLPPTTAIKRLAVAEGKETPVADLKNVYFYNIFLSDDRKQIAYAARTDNRDDIWVMSSGGGPARKLTGNNDSGLYFSRLTWLHDGSSIIFAKQTRYSLLSIITDIR